MLFDNPFERLLISHLAIYKQSPKTYHVRAYLHLGIPYDGAVLHSFEPYYEAEHAEKKYIENQWNCEGSVTRIGFRQAAP